MKRGFEENVPKFRPRVRLGRALDEQVAEAQQLAAEESAAPDPSSLPPLALAGPPTDASATLPLPVAEREPAVPALVLERSPLPDAVPEPSPMPVAKAAPEGQRQEARPEPAPAKRFPRRSLSPSVSEVTDLAHALTADLTRAAETNARLKSDLEAAIAALRQAADEAGEQRAGANRLAADLDSRTSQLRALQGDFEMLEAERDGALAQVARLSRELREEKARFAASSEDLRKSRAETAQAREALDRLTAELRDRLAERDAARAELTASRGDRDRLAEELLAAHADAEAAAQSRTALEEIHKALAEARSRMSSIR